MFLIINLKDDYLRLFILFTLFTVLSCSKNDTEPEVLSEYFSIKLNPDLTEYSADGTTEIEVIAEFPEGLSKEINSIKFSTSAGTFKNNNGANEITTEISNRKASEFLTLGTKEGNFKIKGEIELDSNKFFEEIPIKLLPMNQFFTLNLNRSSALADGNTKITATVMFISEFPDSINTIEFSTSAGEFKNDGAENSVQKPINGNDQVSAIFTVGTVPNEYFVSAKVELNKEEIIIEKPFTLEPVVPDSIFKVSLDHINPLRANNFSEVEITANVINPSFNQSIVFEVENGIFTCASCENKVTRQINSAGIATAIFKIKNEVKDIRLSTSISIPDFKFDTLIPVLPAFPDSLLIDAPSLLVDTMTKKVDFQLYLTRDLGRGEVSKGIKVTPEAYQNDGLSSLNVPVGRFSPAIIETVSFAPNTPNLEVSFLDDLIGQEAIDTLPIIVKFSVLNDNGDLVSDSIIVSYD